MRSVRLVVAACLLGTVAAASADRFLRAPTGYSLRLQEARTEAWWNGDRFDRGTLAFGVLQNLEVGATFERGLSNPDRFGFDLSYNYIRPIVDYTPGIAVGVLDVFNETSDGRAAYLALTMRMGNYDPGNQDVPTELNLGFWSRHGGTSFISFSLPFAEQFRLISEYEGREISAGFDFRPVKGLSVRWVFVEGRPSYGLGFRARF